MGRGRVLDAEILLLLSFSVSHGHIHVCLHYNSTISSNKLYVAGGHAAPRSTEAGLHLACVPLSMFSTLNGNLLFHFALCMRTWRAPSTLKEPTQ